MKYDLDGALKPEQMIKTAFLSYYISMYNTVTKEMGFRQLPVTVDEIYDFIHDMKHEYGKQMPEIRKEDVSYCFHVLQVSGLCRS
jgi:hypothetical protein